MKFLFIAMNNMGELTGGDTIWMNFVRNWGEENEIDIIANQKAKDLFNNIYNPIKPTILNIFLNTVKKTIAGVIRISKLQTEYDYVYSVSDFYPDLIPALIYKLKHPKTKWIAGYYLVAPHPFAQNSPYKRILWLKGTLYWLMQRLSLKLVRRWANYVFITSNPDNMWFPGKKVIVVRGGVNQTGKCNPMCKYSAIFIGRLHYQKGILALMEIWREVNKKSNGARLAIIGDGPLMNQAKAIAPITVDFFGYKNGDEKYALIKDSKIVVHPATFDSGGMACAEAMAFGLPAVGFNLEAYKTYYPKGMIKVSNNQEFVEQIIRLLTNKEAYMHYSKEAKDLIEEQWIWEKRAKQILNGIT